VVPFLEIGWVPKVKSNTFMIGATFKRKNDPEQNCAFLCHVSTRTDDHKHIVDLLRKYKNDLAVGVKAKNPLVIQRLKAAYDDLAETHEGVRGGKFDDLVESIAFFSPGITVKLVNGETDEDVAVKSPYNLFVGGNKLGRGVTIKNLLVSYYGRNPKRPQADTVLQHARMYGYRRKDIGLLRLFLPRQLHIVFMAVNKMERGLRDLIAQRPTEEFRGIYVESGLSATRKNILAPGSIGVYSGGSIYNPAQVMRDDTVKASTEKINKMVAAVGNKTYAEMPIEDIQELIALTMPDQDQLAIELIRGDEQLLMVINELWGRPLASKKSGLGVAISRWVSRGTDVPVRISLFPFFNSRHCVPD
jgi:Z1 domain